jgi:hypothetical protein
MPINLNSNQLNNLGANILVYNEIITDGLVMYLDAGISDSYPGSGNTWTDLSGRGNNGTLVNGPSYSATSGSYIQFDGSNDRVDIANASSLNFGTGEFTILMWVGGISSYPGGNGTLIWKGSRFDANLAGWSAVWAGSPQDLYFIISDGSSRVEGRTIPNAGLNGWSGFKMIGMQRSGTSWNQIVDTNITNLGTYSGNVNNSDTVYLGYNGTYGAYLNYKVAAIQIYNKGLSSAEILQNYNAQRQRFGL